MSTHTFGSPRAVATIDRIREFVATNEMATAPQITQLIGVSQSQINAYLRHMEGAGIIRCAVLAQWQHGGGSSPAVWVIQHEPVRSGEHRIVTVAAARDAGMWRDSLVAALFGEPPKLQGQTA
jgi:hypothetical protein